MNTLRTLTLIPALLLAPLALAAETTDVDAAGAAPAATTEAEAPAVLDTLELNAEQRAERAFRTIQNGLEQKRSSRPEDAKVVVCERAATTGSHRTLIHCATNQHWNLVRANSMARFGGAEGRSMNGGTPKSSKDDSMIVSISGSDYAKLEKRFGKAPADQR
jgi:hypothetical protein